MSILTEKFPDSLVINKKKHLIYTDFRTVLKCNEIIEKEAELSQEDLLKILKMFYVKCNYFTEEHISKMFWFFSCGKEKNKKQFPFKAAGLNNRQPFDFEKDANLIYAGFMQQYGVDLQTENMHWWKFMTLLENLDSDTKLSRIIEYRTLDTANKNLSKQEKEFYKAMQRYYGLEKAPEMPERVKEIEKALINGEDISRLLEGR